MNIAVTRLAGKGADDAALFASFGHTVQHVSPLRAELHPKIIQQFVLAANAGDFDAVYFTSAYAAENIAPLLDRTVSKRCRFIGIGPKTTEILRSYGIFAELCGTYSTRGFVPYLGSWIKDKRIALPRSDVPNPHLIRNIEDAGGLAYEFRVYHLEASGNVLDTDGCDAILFTSSKSFTDAVIPDLSGIRLMAIGEITAETMRNAGYPPETVGDGSIEGTLKALEQSVQN